jgi:aspartyl/asparaginyl beta-hydroxylase (cupin superfamily)
MRILYISIILFVLIILIVKRLTKKKSIKVFHNTDIFPELENIHKIHNNIMKEINIVLEDQQNWMNWPEKDLYENNGNWRIFPLYAFGIWVNDNCSKVPILTKFIKSIPNLKLATLSKLSPGMKLKPHRGWGNHSNNVLRAHYGLIVPENKCYIKVNDKIKYHKEKKWIIFDDSEMHMAENKSDKERLVLIIDLERPKNISKGTSSVGDSKELLEIVKYFKNRQLVV